VIGEEAANVHIRGPPLGDAGHDGVEVIVEQDEISGLAGDVDA